MTGGFIGGERLEQRHREEIEAERRRATFRLIRPGDQLEVTDGDVLAIAAAPHGQRQALIAGILQRGGGMGPGGTRTGGDGLITAGG